VQRTEATPPIAEKTCAVSAATLPPPARSIPEIGAPKAIAPRENSTPGEEKPVDLFARVVAVVGALIAAGNAGFSIYKMRRDRRLSVDDDFWFRKILTPTAIEPALEMFVDLLHDMPTAASSEDTQRKFALKVSTEMLKLHNSMQALALFDKDLPGKVSNKFRECEDVLLDYCNALAATQASEQALQSSVEDVRQRVWGKVSEAMQAIRDRQINA